MILAITTPALVRGVSGEEPPVTVVITPVGDQDYVPIGDRLLPTMVFYAVMIAALFLPAASLVDEREKRTLDAVLVTPTRMSDVLFGKGTFAVLLAVAMALAAYLAQKASQRAREIARTNVTLQQEIAIRQEAERELQVHRDNLEQLVVERHQLAAIVDFSKMARHRPSGGASPDPE